MSYRKYVNYVHACCLNKLMAAESIDSTPPNHKLVGLHLSSVDSPLVRSNDAHSDDQRIDKGSKLGISMTSAASAATRPTFQHDELYTCVHFGR